MNLLCPSLAGLLFPLPECCAGFTWWIPDWESLAMFLVFRREWHAVSVASWWQPYPCPKCLSLAAVNLLKIG